MSIPDMDGVNPWPCVFSTGYAFDGSPAISHGEAPFFLSSVFVLSKYPAELEQPWPYRLSFRYPSRVLVQLT